MLSLIEVTCPHCSAQGQIMLPPLGAIIVGPCPECRGMVAVFCGRVLPLDGAIMGSDNVVLKREHLNEVLGNFLHDRVEQLFDEGDSGEEIGYDPVEQGMTTNRESSMDSTDSGKIAPSRNDQAVAISEAELESFKNVDLRLLDNPDYFKAIFDES